MNAKDQFYGLNGSTQSREDLRTLATLCVGQEHYAEAQRISYILNKYPDAQYFEIEKINEIGLNGADHTGIAKQALDGCGRLRSGYKFEKGGKIVLVAKPLFKKGDLAYSSGDDALVTITGYSKPSRLSALKDELFVYDFVDDAGRRSIHKPASDLSTPTNAQLERDKPVKNIQNLKPNGDSKSQFTKKETVKTIEGKRSGIVLEINTYKKNSDTKTYYGAAIVKGGFFNTTIFKTKKEATDNAMRFITGKEQDIKNAEEVKKNPTPSKKIDKEKIKTSIKKAPKPEYLLHKRFGKVKMLSKTSEKIEIELENGDTKNLLIRFAGLTDLKGKPIFKKVESAPKAKKTVGKVIPSKKIDSIVDITKEIERLKNGKTLAQLKKEDKKAYYKVQSLSSKRSDLKAFEKGNFITKDQVKEYEGLIIWLFNKVNYKGLLDFKQARKEVDAIVQKERVIYKTTKSIKRIVSDIAKRAALDNIDKNLRDKHGFNVTTNTVGNSILEDFQSYKLDVLMGNIGLNGPLEDKEITQAATEGETAFAKAETNTAPTLNGLRKMDAATEKSPLWKIPGATGEFLQDVERKRKESVAVVFSTPAGTGKTTTVYKWMNDIAPVSPTLFLSLEEHPDSNLATDKRDKYLSTAAQANMNTAGSVPDKATLKKWIEAHDVIVIDSWQKLVELIGSTKFDQELRKAYDGKLFIIIFQETVDGKAKGGSDKVFDGDIIIKGEKGASFSQNYLYPEKHRYTKVPLGELRYMIDAHQVINPIAATPEDTEESTEAAPAPAAVPAATSWLTAQ